MGLWSRSVFRIQAFTFAPIVIKLNNLFIAHFIIVGHNGHVFFYPNRAYSIDFESRQVEKEKNTIPSRSRMRNNFIDFIMDYTKFRVYIFDGAIEQDRSMFFDFRVLKRGCSIHWDHSGGLTVRTLFRR
jgi:hypothetical protein